MSFQHLRNETPAQRFILVELEAAHAQPFGGDWRHIRANVVRKAVSHVLAEPDNIDSTKVAHWYDDYFATGYRNCAWSKSTLGAIYTDNLVLRGQFDIGYGSLREGWPYGNRLAFRDCREIEFQQSKAMFDTMNKLDKWKDRQANGSEDEFPAQLVVMSSFLKIDKFLFCTSPQNQSLTNENLYVECNLAEAIIRVEEMLRPFAQPIYRGA